jgi:uncharacterized protein (DUF2235 family)
MAKNIILLSDGTGNSAAKIFKTGVWRLYQAVDLTDANRQVAFYDDGVGSSSLKPWAALTGALGLGLKRNVMQLYKDLCQSYEPGDQIFAFGFSRGAFTIRVLAGLIASQGIIPGRTMDPQELRRRVHAAYREDRKDYRPVWTSRRRNVKSKTPAVATVPSGHHAAKIAFLGLWDTVDAYGLPIDELKRGLDYWWLGLSFPDQDLSPIVKRACHALALDDKRRTFHPVLWNEKVESDLIKANLVEPDRLKQVWFAGMHSNVGGGYAKDGLSYVSLKWMIAEARAAADPSLPLAFHQARIDEIAQFANEHADIGNSRAGLGSYYRYDPRRVSAMCDDEYNKVWIKTPKIHHSVFDRIAGQYLTYTPHMVPQTYCIVGPKGDIVDNVYEKPGEAKARANNLERAWDLVWWRRGVYFLTLALTLQLVLFPWIWEPAKDAQSCVGPFCFLGAGIVAVGSFLPGWLDLWLTAFRISINPFLVLALGLGTSIAFGKWLEQRIEARSIQAWAHVTGAKPASVKRWEPLSKIARALRTSDPLVTAYRWFSREFLPFLFFLLTVAIGVLLVNRLAFEFMEAAGATCPVTSSATLANAPAPGAPAVRDRVFVPPNFATSNPCFDTGIETSANRAYVVELTVVEPWMDGRTPTSPEGFRSSHGVFVHRILGLAKRSWLADWFQPVARIDNVGRDRYILDFKLKRDDKAPTSVALGNAAQSTVGKTYVSKPFVAQNSGRLFLFVNDAIVGLPYVWSYFYWPDNNAGSAKVVVKELDALPSE